eukprot:5980582-Amphidinium_carterae.1
MAACMVHRCDAILPAVSALRLQSGERRWPSFLCARGCGFGEMLGGWTVHVSAHTAAATLSGHESRVAWQAKISKREGECDLSKYAAGNLGLLYGEKMSNSACNFQPSLHKRCDQGRHKLPIGELI